MLHDEATRPAMIKTAEDGMQGLRATSRLRALLVVALSLLALLLWTPGPAPAMPGGLAAPQHSLADSALPTGHAVLERVLWLPDGSGPAPLPAAARAPHPPRRAQPDLPLPLALAIPALRREAPPRAPPASSA